MPSAEEKKSLRFKAAKFQGFKDNLATFRNLETLRLVLPSGTKGEAKPVNRSSKGEETWHVIPMQSAVYAAARA
jgi:hypothetical protein